MRLLSSNVLAQPSPGVAAPWQAKGIRSALEDPQSEYGCVRTNAAWALGDMGAVDQIGAIVVMLKDPRPGVRSAAACALGSLGARAQAARLVLVLKDPKPRVRGAARWWLRLLLPVAGPALW
jgi:HEAT repeat protein